MLPFYWTLLKKSFLQFRQVLTPWRFWVWIAGVFGAVLVWVVPAEYQERYLRFELPVWALPALLALVSVYVVLRVNYDEAEKPRRELEELKQALARAESEERLKTIKLVETLRTLQKAGLDLRKEMKRNVPT
jgi:glucan phosphoethanolaminetransferase (alkaline phosphatase superfamily)